MYMKYGYVIHIWFLAYEIHGFEPGPEFIWIYSVDLNLDLNKAFDQYFFFSILIF